VVINVELESYDSLGGGIYNTSAQPHKSMNHRELQVANYIDGSLIVLYRKRGE